VRRIRFAGRAIWREVRQHVEIAISSLKRAFDLGETLASTLVGLATRIAAKMTAYNYAFLATVRWVVLKAESWSCGLIPDNIHLMLVGEVN
jgi:hypothetical protein